MIDLHNSPSPFNKDALPKEVIDKIHRVHELWCDANPDVTQEERAEAYKKTHERIIAQYKEEIK